MCNRYRVSPKQLELAKRYGFDISKLFPEPETLPPPELFPKKPGWIVRKVDGELSLDVMTWGIPLGFGVILFTIIVTAIYVMRANREYDDLTDRIKREALK